MELSEAVRGFLGGFCPPLSCLHLFFHFLTHRIESSTARLGSFGTSRLLLLHRCPRSVGLPLRLMRKSLQDCVVSVATTVTQTAGAASLGQQIEGGSLGNLWFQFVVCMEAAAAAGERGITERSQFYPHNKTIYCPWAHSGKVSECV